MGQALIWFDVLLASLLWVAWLVAVASGMKSRALRIIASAAAIIPPLLLLGTLTSVAVALRYGQDLPLNGFSYSASLAGAFVIGTLILWAARARLAGRAGVLAVAFLLAASLAGATLWVRETTVQAQVASLRAKMLALALPLSSPLPGDADNAATLYEIAFSSFEGKSCCRLADDPYDLDRADLADPVTIKYLARHEKTISVLRQAAARTACRFVPAEARYNDEDLAATSGYLRTAARLLRLHARRELAEGRVESAIQDAATLFRMATHATHEGRLVSLQASCVIEGIATDVLQQTLPAVTAARQLAALKIEPVNHNEALTRALRFEEVAGLGLFDNLAGGPVPSIRQGLGNRFGAASRVIGPAAETLYRDFLLSEQIQAYRQWLAVHQWLGRQPYSEARSRIQRQADLLAELRRTVPEGLADPALAVCHRDATIARAQHEVARVAVAATQYRLASGKTPEGIDVLVPAYLDSVPSDPFDGEPLRLRNADGAASIYSVGSDGKNDIAFSLPAPATERESSAVSR